MLGKLIIREFITPGVIVLFSNSRLFDEFPVIGDRRALG